MPFPSCQFSGFSATAPNYFITLCFQMLSTQAHISVDNMSKIF